MASRSSGSVATAGTRRLATPVSFNPVPLIKHSTRSAGPTTRSPTSRFRAASVVAAAGSTNRPSVCRQRRFHRECLRVRHRHRRAAGVADGRQRHVGVEHHVVGNRARHGVDPGPAGRQRFLRRPIQADRVHERRAAGGLHADQARQAARRGRAPGGRGTRARRCRCCPRRRPARSSSPAGRTRVDSAIS